MSEFEVLRALMRRQHGVLTRTQALAAGMSARQIEYRLARGEWIAICKGLYRASTSPLTYKAKALAACLHAGDGAVASHMTAAALHELDDARPGRIEITVPRDGHHESPLAVVHRASHLSRQDVRRIDGVRCTGVARTLCDIAPRLTPAGLVDVVDGAIVDRKVKLAAALAALARAEDGPGRAGAAALRETLALWDDGGAMPESRGETQLLRELLRRGFPAPERQFEVWVGGVLLGRVDLAYVPERVALEYDGSRRHLDPGRARENALVAAGWRVLVATKYDVTPAARRFYAALSHLLGLR
jgi:predicted transcriptional regulator of viral defense system